MPILANKSIHFNFLTYDSHKKLNTIDNIVRKEVMDE